MPRVTVKGVSGNEFALSETKARHENQTASQKIMQKNPQLNNQTLPSHNQQCNPINGIHAVVKSFPNLFAHMWLIFSVLIWSTSICSPGSDEDVIFCSVISDQNLHDLFMS